MTAQAWRLKLSRIVTELAQLLAPLNAVLFTFGNDRVSVAELLGFATGAASVYLTVRAHISNFPVGIANSAFFLVLFLAARLYADSGLQVVYIVLGFIGWWQWPTYGSAATSPRTRAACSRGRPFTVTIGVTRYPAVRAGRPR